MNFNLRDATTYLVLAGSRAYGTHNESSDFDFRGIAISPIETYVGILDKFEQVVDLPKAPKNHWKNYADLIPPDSDLQVMELTKFARLACNANPSILETLFTEKGIYLEHPVMKKLLDIKQEFLTKRCKAAFCGYAREQLDRLKLHKRYLDHPILIQPKRSDFDLPDYKELSSDQFGAAFAIINAEVNEYAVNQNHLPEELKKELFPAMRRMLKKAWQGIHLDVPYPIGYGKKFNKLDDAVIDAVAVEQQFLPNFIEILRKERKYRIAKKDYESYQTWVKERNPERAELERKYGVDCHVEETEFLTDSGWKLYDQISEQDKLATINSKSFKIEYQSFKERFESLFTGNLYNLYGRHLDVQVTPNHRMMVRKVERRSGKKSEFEKIQISHLPDTFEILKYPTPNKKNFCQKNIFDGLPFDKTFMSLMGWYLSDGSMVFRKNKPKNICISQKKNGKLYSVMKKFFHKYKNLGVSFGEYIRKPNVFNPNTFIEASLRISNKNIVNRLFADCGFKETKRIPRWAFGLSKRMMDALLSGLIMGDGYIGRPDNSIIYYSKSKSLANDVQELAMMCGYETSLYGPYKGGGHGYEVEMYQVHINKTREQFKSCVRSKNIKIVPVQNKKVVCFSVPNDTLVTRLNGHIGFHHNSKHASHLVRLLNTGKEILTDARMHVYRNDSEKLRAIRNGTAFEDGTWTCEKLFEFAEKENEEMEILVKNSTLPAKPDMRKVHDTVCEMVLEFNGIKNESLVEKIVKKSLVEEHDGW